MCTNRTLSKHLTNFIPKKNQNKTKKKLEKAHYNVSTNWLVITGVCPGRYSRWSNIICQLCTMAVHARW